MDWLIGFRADEQKRVQSYETQKYKTPCFPLFERNIRLDDVFDFWKQKPYTLEIPRILGNCDLCFLKGKNNIIKILAHYPELATKWIADEERTGKSFFKDTTYKELLHVATHQKQLFPLNDLESAYQCTCNQY
jgi:hypothetical protein